VSDFHSFVVISRWWFTLGGSVLLHIAVFVLVWLTKTPSLAGLERPSPRTPLTVGMNAVAVEPVSVSEGLATETVPRNRSIANPTNIKPILPSHVQSEGSVKAVAKERATRNAEPLASPEQADSVTVSELGSLPSNDSTARVLTGEPTSVVSAPSLKEAMLDATKRQGAPMVGGGFGSMEMLLKERRLERALTWVFPKVVSNDRSYWQWPFGSVGKIRFTVELSAEGRIESTRFVDSKPSARLQSLIGRMTLFLRPGRFALGGNKTGESVQRDFELSVTHLQRGKSPSGELGDIDRLGFDAPQADRPGRGYVLDTTGQELMAELRELTTTVSPSSDSPGP
jgi:hypothetical protein